jgi:hypothetical protein
MRQRAIDVKSYSFYHIITLNALRAMSRND